MKRARSLFVVLLAAVFVLAGCDKKSPAPPGKTPEAAQPPPKGDGGHGKMIELGKGNAGPFAITASRADTAITPGGEVPVDIAVNSGPKATAVRFWIGVEGAKGSVKGRAEVDELVGPNHWHAHGEIPDPIPAGSKLWVEIEGEGGAKGTASFDLKR